MATRIPTPPQGWVYRLGVGWYIPRLDPLEPPRPPPGTVDEARSRRRAFRTAMGLPPERAS